MIKVLMLGWEFPPLFSGGLGIATYGIVKALRKKTSIRLVIPAAPDVTEWTNVDIIGLNRVTAAEIDLERLQFSVSFPDTEVISVPVTISYYHHVNAQIENSGLDDFKMLFAKKTLETIHRIFHGKEVYGPNILNKVHLFAMLVE